MHVKDVIKQKHRVAHTISSDRTAEDAIVHMTERHASAIIVMEGKVPVGIFTERDVLRCHVKWRGRLFREMPLTEAMTDKLIVAQPEDLVSSAMAMMIQADIRHLPVVENQRIVGMVTISADFPLPASAGCRPGSSWPWRCSPDLRVGPRSACRSWLR